MGLRASGGQANSELLERLFGQRQAGKNAPQPNSLFDQLKRGAPDDPSKQATTSQSQDSLSISRGAFLGTGTRRGAFLT